MEYKSSFKNLIIVGTVAAVCAVATLFGGSPAPIGSAINLSANIEIEQAFIQYIAKYGKSYSSKDEIPKRFESFAENFRIVQAHNANPNALYQMELNQFADMPHTQSSLKSFLETEGVHPNLKDLAPNQTIPESVNWNISGKMNPVYDQMTCNADWALSSIETLEAALAIKNKASPSQYRMSINQLIDCDTQNSGCMGGWPSRAWKFYAKNGYLAPQDYFYDVFQGVKRQCASWQGKPVNRLPTNFRGRQYLMLNVNITKAFVAVQPLAVAVNTPRCLKLYKTGILSKADCECTAASYEEVEVNELMSIVGYGQVQPDSNEAKTCDGFWIVRASYGTSWGENGYVRLCIPKDTTDSIGTCNVQVYPMFPDVGLPMPIFT